MADIRRVVADINSDRTLKMAMAEAAAENGRLIVTWKGHDVALVSPPGALAEVPSKKITASKMNNTVAILGGGKDKAPRAIVSGAAVARSAQFNISARNTAPMPVVAVLTPLEP